jgi:predicted Zn-dependent peptidase
MLFKGTQKRNAYQIAREIDRVGGIVNAFTERETTCFYSTIPCEHLKLAVDVLSDMIFHSLLDPEEIEKEKSVIVNEILSLQDSPEELAHDAYLTGLWGDHPLAWKITGEVEDIQAVDRESLVSFYNSHINPSNLIVSVAGRFDSEAVCDLIRGFLDGRESGDPLAGRKPPVKRRAWKQQGDRFKQTQIYCGTDLAVVRGDHETLYDAQVFSIAVGESMSSRLFQAIREEKALCYSISSFRTIYTDTSLWTIYSNTSPDLVKPLLDSLDEELNRLSKESLTEQEISDAKSHLKGNLTMSKEDMEVRMKRLVRLHNLVGNVIDYEGSTRYIDEVSRQRVLRIADELVRGDGFNLLVYGGENIEGFDEVRFTF